MTNHKYVPNHDGNDKAISHPFSAFQSFEKSLKMTDSKFVSIVKARDPRTNWQCPSVHRSLMKARDCRQNGMIEEKEDVSPHLMAKIRIIQDEIGKIDSQLTKIKQAIRNYQNSSIFYLGRETELRAHWPHVTQIRKIDRMIRNLKKYEFERANDIEKQIIEQHSKTLMDLLIELIIKYHQGRIFDAQPIRARQAKNIKFENPFKSVEIIKK